MQVVQKSRFRAFLERAFVEREFYLRVDGKVRYIRLGSRVQMAGAALILVCLTWVSYASLKTLIHEQIVSAKDREIELSRLAYADLLAEIDSYHGQFAKIIESLENNQAYLLSMLENEKTEGVDKAAIEERLERSKAAKEKILAAREALREKLDDVGLNAADGSLGEQLKNQISQIKALLEATEEERSQVTKAREDLAARLQRIQSQLLNSRKDKHGLQRTVDRLEQELDKSKADRTQLTAAQLALSVQIGRLQTSLWKSRERETHLESELADVEAALGDAVALGDDLANDRDELLGKVVGLEGRLSDLQQTQRGVVARLTTQTRTGIGVLENTITTAGLDPETLLARIQDQVAGQGGPFVPADGSVTTTDFAAAPSEEFSIASLDAHVNRWEALQHVMKALPLAPPVDNYRLTSGFGVRKDPLNGRRARHNGLDFAAAIGAKVRATAPGTVTFAGWYGRYGRMIEIDHGYGIRTRVAHLRKIYVKVGQRVNFRDKIGMQGNSGRSRGPHVHYEIRVDGRPVDPMNFLKAGRNVFKG